MDLELELFGDLKEKSAGSAVGKVFMLSLSSQPVDHEASASGRNKVCRRRRLFCSGKVKEPFECGTLCVRVHAKWKRILNAKLLPNANSPF